jgi:hypothetical protein
VIYNILTIKSPDDEFDPFYPSVDKSLFPVLTGHDGQIAAPYSVSGLTVSVIEDEAFKKIAGATGLSGDLWVTDHRIIVRCNNYDKVKWTGENNVDAWVFGAGTESALFLAAKAYHRVRSMGKTMTGHVYMPWIRSIAYCPQIGRAQPAAVRLQLTKKLQDGSTKDIFLSISLTKGTDSKAVAQEILRRCLRWWSVHETGLTKEQEQQVQNGLSQQLWSPEPGKMTVINLPVFRHPFANNFTPTLKTAATGAVATTSQTETRIDTVAETTTREGISPVRGGTIFVQTLIDHSSQYRPPFDWMLTDPELGTQASAFGCSVTADRQLEPASAGEVLWHANVATRGTVCLADDGRPGLHGGTLQPLFKGTGELLVTKSSIFVLVANGWTALGFVGPEEKSALIVSMPLEMVSFVGVVMVGPKSGRTEPDLQFMSGDKLWGAIWVERIMGTMKPDAGEWPIQAATLSEAATGIAEAMCEMHGDPRPTPHAEGGGFIYLVATQPR